jgi:two-component system NtrC family sensor kinase
MKLFISITLFFLIGFQACFAQDSTVMLTSNMLDSATNSIFLSNIKGWLFKKGNNMAWSAKDYDVDGWSKLMPAELSSKNADKNGKAECWFRIKIKPDTSFKNKPLGIKMFTYGAADVYVNGDLKTSFGNIGIDRKPFREYNPLAQIPAAINLEAGDEYILAIHFIDYVSPFPPARLKSQDLGIQSMIRLTVPTYATKIISQQKELSLYGGILISVTIFFSLLFWLLTLQNRQEKNLWLISTGSTFLALHTFFSFINTLTSLSYNVTAIAALMASVFAALMVTFTTIVLAKLFNRKISHLIKIVLLVCLVALIVPDYFRLNLPNGFSAVAAGIPFIICIYYIASSWKHLKGAQWAIVTGFLLSFFFGMIFIVLFTFFPLVNLYIYRALYTIASPLGMLVYVSMRFKEIINEVRENAQQVVQLSEEKRVQALNQQSMLEEEVAKQTAELRTTLSDLKSTQAQLVQSEKMASLGELTAGIAHEIQNPLNFVNNFSEVNKEMIEELQTELKSGNVDEAINISNDIKDNSEKINHHGKRADAIVKGMLQHSRSSSSVKEPTDINALADEYLRLSYHGLRAKDKDFNATMKTYFDESIGNITIIPQDIGRVLLNLYNNAFYAVAEKKKVETQNYEPTISIKTKKLDGKIEVSVKDNGNGIPQKIVDKIFQPFFTTKPTGQGTGLGLSLSYDIIKTHGGEIKVESMEGEGSEFVVQMPSA